MQQTTKQFKLGAVLTALSGIMLAADVSEVYEILNFLVDDDLYTHQLPRAFSYVQPYLKLQFPQFENIQWGTVDKDTWKEFVVDLEAQHGSTLDVCAINTHGWQHVHPIEELGNMMGDKPIIVGWLTIVTLLIVNGQRVVRYVDELIRPKPKIVNNITLNNDLLATLEKENFELRSRLRRSENQISRISRAMTSVHTGGMFVTKEDQMRELLRLIWSIVSGYEIDGGGRYD